MTSFTSSSEDGDFLLLEVASVLLVNQHKVQIVPRGELFVDYISA